MPNPCASGRRGSTDIQISYLSWQPKECHVLNCNKCNGMYVFVIGLGALQTISSRNTTTLTAVVHPYLKL